ncbi:MAG: RHS repeat protein, partial [Ectothiorhodospiraceae bacterium]|nr:RHS repeat protein [Ectothiorhodospiraceae bacterium]
MVYHFENNAGVWLDPFSRNIALVESGLGWLFTDEDNTKELYDSNGVLLSISNVRGNIQTLSYDDNERLDRVDTNTGEFFQFGYDVENRISTLSDHTGRTWSYRYDESNNLEFVDNPDGTFKQYHYEDLIHDFVLTGITDERFKRYATWAYNTEGKAISSEHAGGVERVELMYNPDGSTTVTGSLGATRIYSFVPERGRLVVSQIEGDQCVSCPNGEKKDRNYDASGYLAGYTDWSNAATELGNYDPKGQYGFKIEAAGTPEQRRTDYTYDPRFNNKMTSRVEISVASASSKTTTYVYDDFANRTSMSVAGFRPDGVAVSRTTTYQYTGPLNQLSQVDGPRTDVVDITTLEYYANDVTQGFNRGRLQRITGPAGIVLRDTIAYTATGKVLSEDRPNGISLAYTYYAGNDRLETLSETSGGATPSTRTTRWTYLASGEVETITQADGSAIATSTRLVYDDARRLIGMVDQLGNHIDYELDTEGNRTDEKVFDSANVLYKSVQQSFDIYNRLDTRTLVDEIIDYNFQPDGSLDNSVNAKNVSTDFQYDALKRLTTTTGDLGGVDADTQDTLTQYVYDAGDRLTSVTSPNNNSTAYRYDDLGNLLSETSPDRGLRRYTHDAAGNVSSITDARSITVTYTYDALNRVTAIDYPGTAEDISMTYDTATGCSKGVGKLCLVTDNSGSTTYTYSDFGNLEQQTTTQLGVAYSTAYLYDDLNRVTSMTAPSGRIITSGYDALGRIASIDATVNGSTQTLVHNTQYRPDGQLTDIEYGNGYTETRQYNLKARL